MEKTKRTILIFAAEPLNMVPLYLTEETKSIREEHERSLLRDSFEIPPENYWTTPSDIQRLLNKYKPNIVHFCGHGIGHQKEFNKNINRDINIAHPNKESSLILTDEFHGAALDVPDSAIVELFKIFKDDIECVILNACSTQQLAEQIHEFIPYVIGTRRDIGNKAAKLFSEGFYRALFNDGGYKKAYDLGCNMINLSKLEDNKTPIIYIHNVITTREKPQRQTPKSSPDKSKYMLIPYLPNRQQQIKALTDIISEVKQHGPFTPIPFLLHGDDQQCSKKFIECIKDYHIEPIVKKNFKKAYSTEVSCQYIELPKTGMDQVKFNNAMYEELNNVSYPGINKLLQINPKKLHEYFYNVCPRHYIFYSIIYSESWDSYRLESLNNYYSFWQQWPPQSRKLVAAFLIIIYNRLHIEKKRIALFNDEESRKKIIAFKTNEKFVKQIRQVLNPKERYKLLPELFKKYRHELEPYHILPELSDIYLQELESYFHNKIVIKEYGDKAEGCITALYKKHGRLSMYLISQALKNLHITQ